MPCIEFFELGGRRGGSADIAPLIFWGGRGRDDTYESVIVTLPDL